MNKLDKNYTNLLQDILDNGVTKKDRTGTGTISIFGKQIRHNMKDGFPLLTTKKMPFKTIVTELIWFLRGDTSIKYLVDNNCYIWNGDCYKHYLKNWEPQKAEANAMSWMDQKLSDNRALSQDMFIHMIKTNYEFAKKWGELGPIYGKQWRKWGGIIKKSIGGTKLFSTGFTQIDQIQNLINDLKTNPDSRRLMVNAWNVGELDQMTLPPCHFSFQVYTRELTNDEIINYYYKNIKPNTKWKQDKDGKYFYFVEFDDESYWVEHSGSDILFMKPLCPTRAISLMWSQRSVDTFLGLPFNIASYGLLLEIIAKEVNMVPDELIGNLGDVHLYSNHIEQAKEQIGIELSLEERKNIWNKNNFGENMVDADVLELLNEDNIPTRTREPFPLPKLILNPIFLTNLEHKGFDVAINDQINFQLENYESHPTIKAPLSN